MMNASSKKVEEEREQEHEDVDHDQEADLAPGSPDSRCSTHLCPSTP